MKHLIAEKQNSLTVFIDSNSLMSLCGIADYIEECYPESVMEVTHNRIAKQGSIILRRNDPDLANRIEILLNDYEQTV